MPQYLRRATVRLFEASMEALHLALVGLALPVRRDVREPASKHSACIGLIGSSAEQAMGAVLVHVFGEDVLEASSSQFKSAREILADLRDLLRKPVPRASVLTAGVAAPTDHLAALAAATSGFTVLLAERAAGLHAGSGPTRAAVVIAAARVQEFLALLARSTRIRSYLEDLPRLPEPVPQRTFSSTARHSKLTGPTRLPRRRAYLGRST
ncbi:MAG: hypothetical protein IPM79_18475 [Polyangiaceae bacterium]|nr:hypothetical protein [Polyangiaceae bacterium]